VPRCRRDAAVARPLRPTRVSPMSTRPISGLLSRGPPGSRVAARRSVSTEVHERGLWLRVDHRGAWCRGDRMGGRSGTGRRRARAEQHDGRNGRSAESEQAPAGQVEVRAGFIHETKLLAHGSLSQRGDEYLDEHDAIHYTRSAQVSHLSRLAIHDGPRGRGDVRDGRECRSRSGQGDPMRRQAPADRCATCDHHLGLPAGPFGGSTTIYCRRPVSGLLRT
jgi:hypothetical protein